MDLLSDPLAIIGILIVAFLAGSGLALWIRLGQYSYQMHKERHQEDEQDEED